MRFAWTYSVSIFIGFGLLTYNNTIMLQFLDIIISPGEWEQINRQRRRNGFPEIGTSDVFQKAKPDTVFQIQSATDSASVDSLMNKGVADSVPDKNSIIDTLQASGAFTNGPAAGDDSTALIWTVLAIIAALALCFCFIGLYRRHCSATQ